MNLDQAKTIQRAAYNEYFVAKREFVVGLCDWNHVEATKLRHNAACDIVHDIAAGIDIAARYGFKKNEGCAHVWSQYRRDHSANHPDPFTNPACEYVFYAKG